MEDKNQSDKTGEISKITSESSQSLSNFNSLSFFKKDKKFFFAHQKIERLVSAIYLMTNGFQDEEPVKWSLRSLGTELLRLNIDLKEGVTSEIKTIERRIQDRSLETVSLLEVAFFAGLISEMNLDIIKREFHNLLNYINTILREKRDGVSVLESSFFNVDEADLREEISANEKPYPSEMSNTNKLPSVNQTDESNYIKDKNTSVKKTERSEDKVSQGKLKKYGPVAVKRNKRQSAIINLLKRKKEIMVRDVAEIVHDCSEKTLQRELLVLVSQGVLKKEGERRWSRYSLA